MTEEIVISLKEFFQKNGFTFDRRNGQSSIGQPVEFKIIKENKAYRIRVEEIEYKLLS